MATIKLTDTTWQDREYEKVKGVLYQALGGENRNGKNVLELRAMLKYAGLDYYTDADLLAFKNQLIADGIAEELP